MFLEAAAPTQEAGEQGGSQLVCRSLGNLLRADRLGSELTTVHPVSTFVSASSFSKLFSLLRTFIPAPGSKWAKGRGGCVLAAGRLAWDRQPGLFHELPLLLSKARLPPGSGNSREPTLTRLPRPLRLLGSRVCPVETRVCLESCGSALVPKTPLRKESSPFLTPGPGFDWTYGTRKGGTNVTMCLLTECQEQTTSHSPSATPCPWQTFRKSSELNRTSSPSKA